MKKRRISVYLCDYNIMVGVVPNAILQFSGPQIRQLKRALKQCWGQYIIPTAFSIVFIFIRIFCLCAGSVWTCSLAFVFCFLFNLLFWILFTFERRRREYSMNAEKWMKCSQKMYSVRIARVNKHEHFSFELRFVSFFFSQTYSNLWEKVGEWQVPEGNTGRAK